MVTGYVKIAFCVFVLLQLALVCQGTSREDRKLVRGGWKDNYGRTIWICSSCDNYDDSLPCRYYISWTRVNSTVNITGFANTELRYSRDDREHLELRGSYWEMNNITKRTLGDDAIHKSRFRMRLFNPSKGYNKETYWSGVKDDNKEWVWNQRFFNMEPAPSSCMRPITLQPQIAAGRWQRTTSSGDVLYINLCPNGSGRWQFAFSGQGGLLRGDFEKHSNVTQWFGRRIYTTETGVNKLNQSTVDAISGASVITQVGSRVLSEINTSPTGAWVESRTFNYIGIPEDCSSAPSFHLSMLLHSFCFFVLLSVYQLV